MAVDRPQRREELLRRALPRVLLAVAAHRLARQLQRAQAGHAQVGVQHAAGGAAHHVDRPGTGKAATGVPQAMDSAITRPKVSVTLGNTITSALR
ncbi:hypothetical protein Y694_03787 [Methylibium sp. T29-B]|nr:hypothetical protein Y694_03787 [Methylibium sp. T29-B]